MQYGIGLISYDRASPASPVAQGSPGKTSGVVLEFDLWYTGGAEIAPRATGQTGPDWQMLGSIPSVRKGPQLLDRGSLFHHLVGV